MKYCTTRHCSFVLYVHLNKPAPRTPSVVSGVANTESLLSKQGYNTSPTVLSTMSSDKVGTEYCTQRTSLAVFLLYCFVFP